MSVWRESGVRAQDSVWKLLCTGTPFERSDILPSKVPLPNLVWLQILPVEASVFVWAAARCWPCPCDSLLLPCLIFCSFWPASASTLTFCAFLMENCFWGTIPQFHPELHLLFITSCSFIVLLPRTAGEMVLECGVNADFFPLGDAFQRACALSCLVNLLSFLREHLPLNSNQWGLEKLVDVWPWTAMSWVPSSMTWSWKPHQPGQRRPFPSLPCWAAARWLSPSLSTTPVKRQSIPPKWVEQDPLVWCQLLMRIQMKLASAESDPSVTKWYPGHHWGQLYAECSLVPVLPSCPFMWHLPKGQWSCCPLVGKCMKSHMLYAEPIVVCGVSQYGPSRHSGRSLFKPCPGLHLRPHTGKPCFLPLSYGHCCGVWFHPTTTASGEKNGQPTPQPCNKNLIGLAVCLHTRMWNISDLFFCLCDFWAGVWGMLEVRLGTKLPDKSRHFVWDHSAFCFTSFLKIRVRSGLAPNMSTWGWACLWDSN